MDFNKDNDIVGESEAQYTVQDIIDVNTQEEECDFSFAPQEQATPKRKDFPLQTPVIVAIIAFLLTALIIFSSLLVYDAFDKTSDEQVQTSVSGYGDNIDSDDEYVKIYGDLVGTWTGAGTPGEVYITFEADGTVFYSIGTARQYGTYSTEIVTATSDEAGVETYNVFTSELYLFANYGGSAVVEFSEDSNNVSLTFVYGVIELVRAELPEIKLNPQEIIHASADELGVTSLELDDAIVGTWQTELMGYEDKFEKYTFNADGTGYYFSDYMQDTYYGYGYGLEFDFQYTVKDGKILMSQVMYDGETNDIVFEYNMDKGNLLMDFGTGMLAYKKIG